MQADLGKGNFAENLTNRNHKRAQVSSAVGTELGV